MIDVLVVGAGPAGLTAAAECASKGLDVKVVERGKDVGDKLCGAVLTPSVTREFKPKCGGMNLHKLTLQAGNTSARLDLEHPLFSVDKRELDQYLLDKALDAGAGIEFNRIYKRDEKARVVVNASGASKLEKRNLAITAQTHVRDECGEFRFIYDKEVSDHGYGWVIPKKEGLVVGTACLLSKIGNPHRIRECLNKLLEKEGLETKEEPMFALLPFTGPVKETITGNEMLVGDAAGFTSPLSGEGIYYAMKSASIASEVALEVLEYETSLIEYKRRCRKSFGSILWMNSLIAGILYGNDFILEYLLGRIEGNQALKSFLNRYMNKEGISFINCMKNMPPILGGGYCKWNTGT